MEDVDGGTAVEAWDTSMVAKAGGEPGLLKGNLIVSAVQGSGRGEANGEEGCEDSKGQQEETRKDIKNDCLPHRSYPYRRRMSRSPTEVNTTRPGTVEHSSGGVDIGLKRFVSSIPQGDYKPSDSVIAVVSLHSSSLSQS